MFRWLLWRDVTLAWRRRSDVFGGLFFFVITASLFPLSIGPEITQLRSIAPGVLWVAALLASVVSLPRLFADDFADGTLDQLLLTKLPLSAVVAAKVLALGLVSTAPLILTAPLVGLQFGLTRSASVVLMSSLMLGAPVLLLVGSIGAALTLGLRGAAALTSLVVMPLYIPTLVFGAGAVEAALTSGSPAPNLKLLGALAILALAFAPWSTAASLRISLE
jgi:heme exporter protein B